MISDEVAELVDFLVSKQMAWHNIRLWLTGRKKLDYFYNPHHKAILKMIQIVVDNTHKYGKWARICEELGADFELKKPFLHMGVMNFL